MEELQGELSSACEPELEVQGEADILTLLRIRDQIKQQLMECTTTAHMGQENYRDGATEKQFDKSTMEDLRRDIEELQVSFRNKTLALQRIQFMVALRDQAKQNDSDSQLILETIEHIINLSKSIIEYQERARLKEEELIDARRKRFSLKNTTTEKLLQIQAMMTIQKEQQAKTEKSKAVEKIRDDLQKERHVISVIQNVFQRIIIGSRVNWAEDPSLRAIVLQLEKNPCLP